MATFLRANMTVAHLLGNDLNPISKLTGKTCPKASVLFNIVQVGGGGGKPHVKKFVCQILYNSGGGQLAI